ncbi:predicted protein [Naegleria gruberi]|uniref:Predicted protein n=1 Tax=Naegleria gruberi TaxID=5762 RepID=D2VDW8_NAEGR|nr:uncharacterized protein NAEGRDRAFT_67068 [Naegleria gruberi]EFC44974.1 predicted protein [Naegleria gruberi]|eukprot:XP_002677718.1 predicted protein [Naegleria gruberi strain NEG-M]
MPSLPSTPSLNNEASEEEEDVFQHHTNNTSSTFSPTTRIIATTPVGINDAFVDHPIATEIRTPLKSQYSNNPLSSTASFRRALSTSFSSIDLKEMKNRKKAQVVNYFGKEAWKLRWRGFVNLLKSRKLYETLLICYLFIPLGVGLAMLGPTMPILSKKLGVAEGEMGILFTMRGIGYILSSMIGGWVLDLLKGKVKSIVVQTILNQVLLLLGLVLLSGAFITIPFLNRFLFVAMTYFFCGLGLGFIDLTSNVLVIWVWGNNKLVSAFLQFLHACFGIGSFMCPIIVRIINDAYPTIEGQEEHPIKNALALSYFIGAGIAISGVIPIAIFCFLAYKRPADKKATEPTKQIEQISKSFEDVEEKDFRNIGDIMHDMELEEKSQDSIEVKNEEPEEEQEEQDEEEEEGDKLIQAPLWKKLVVSGLTAFALLNYVGAEIGFGSLIVTYIDKTKVTTEDEGFLINSAFWLSFTIARFGCIILTSIFSDATLLVLDAIGCFAGMIPLLIFPSSPTVLWISSIILGAAFASQYPLTISLPASYMRFEVSGWMTSIMILGGCIGELLIPLGMTLAFEHISPVSIFYLIFIACCIASVCYAILLIAFRFKKQKKVEEIVDEVDDKSTEQIE